MIYFPFRIQAIGLLLISILAATRGYSQAGTKLEPWKKGMLDMHFISNGVGNCAFYILPDGTTLLVDAGEENPTSARVNSPRNTPRYPNYSKLGYEWHVDYISGQLKKLNQDHIDYALITHYHDDHFGGIYPGIPKSENGNYFLSGITGVGDKIPIRKLIDRGYSYPVDMVKDAAQKPASYPTLQNYWNFIEIQKQRSGLKHETLSVGSKDQIALVNEPARYTNFHIRNINANGVVWSGREESSTISKMPVIAQGSYKGRMPGENPLSCGIQINYGKFSFYTGGDIAGKQPDFMQEPDWIDVESLVAPVIGEVDVTTCNHHANRDAMSSDYLRSLKPRVIVQQVWSSDHPGHETLLRMTSKNLWPAPRDLFATSMLLANKLVIGDLIDSSYRSLQGHIVVRVLPPGDQYYVYILDNQSTERTVTNVFGPYSSKTK